MILQFDEFEFEPERLELWRAGKLLRVELSVLRLLAVLVSNAGRLVTKQELIEQVWQGRTLSESAISVAMLRLRKALGHKTPDYGFVTTVYGRGYSFVAPVQLVVPAVDPRLSDRGETRCARGVPELVITPCPACGGCSSRRRRSIV